MLWECEPCGCKGIAAGLAACPMCFTERSEDMAKITVDGGATNVHEGLPVTEADEQHDRALGAGQGDPDPKPIEPAEDGSEPPKALPKAPKAAS